ncbi:hypothetical protein BDZ91DRAFT_790672 [Kalaharituber pfeilii]|nr:hypothetical protein BDZ91DRAFT_790672 [Kalaharituber pfeilii]
MPINCCWFCWRLPDYICTIFCCHKFARWRNRRRHLRQRHDENVQSRVLDHISSCFSSQQVELLPLRNIPPRPRSLTTHLPDPSVPLPPAERDELYQETDLNPGPRFLPYISTEPAQYHLRARERRNAMRQSRLGDGVSREVSPRTELKATPKIGSRMELSPGPQTMGGAGSSSQAYGQMSAVQPARTGFSRARTQLTSAMGPGKPPNKGPDRMALPPGNFPSGMKPSSAPPSTVAEVGTAVGFTSPTREETAEALVPDHPPTVPLTPNAPSEAEVISPTTESDTTEESPLPEHPHISDCFGRAALRGGSSGFRDLDVTSRESMIDPTMINNWRQSLPHPRVRLPPSLPPNEAAPSRSVHGPQSPFPVSFVRGQNRLRFARLLTTSRPPALILGTEIPSTPQGSFVYEFHETLATLQSINSILSEQIHGTSEIRNYESSSNSSEETRNSSIFHAQLNEQEQTAQSRQQRSRQGRTGENISEPSMSDMQATRNSSISGSDIPRGLDRPRIMRIQTLYGGVRQHTLTGGLTEGEASLYYDVGRAGPGIVVLEYPTGEHVVSDVSQADMERFWNVAFRVGAIELEYEDGVHVTVLQLDEDARSQGAGTRTGVREGMEEEEYAPWQPQRR